MNKNKKLSSLVLAVFLLTIFMGFRMPQAMAAGSLTDVNGHWAQSQIENLVNKGIVSGYPDNTFKPGNTITRAEFMVMVNRAFTFTATATVNFKDVKSSDWYAGEIAKAAAAGYITGYQDGTMQPDQAISRQETAAIMAKILKLDTTGSSALTFGDAASIPAWSKNAVAAMVKSGYLSGYPDGTFKAANSITRAEAAVIIARSLGIGEATAATYSQAGTYGPATGIVTINGDVTISAPDVVLQNTIITGNLVIAASVGEGNVTLTNVTVKGNTTINGGGANSIKVNSCALGKVISNKRNVHIVCANGTTVASVTLANGATVDVAAGASIAGVTVSANGTVTLNGSFNNITVDGAQANVNLAGGTVTNLSITANASGAAVNLATGSTVTNLTADAAASLTGSGTITTATVNVAGVSIAQTPTTYTVAKDVDSNIGGKEITGTGIAVTTGSTGGGGGGGGGGSTTTAASISNISAAISNGSSLYNSSTKTVTLTGNADSMLTAITVTAVPANASFTFTRLQASDKGISIPLNTTESCQNPVTIKTLLGDLDTGANGVSLGSLSRALGSSVILTGNLSAFGYSTVSGMEITIELPTTFTSATPSFVSNKWVTVTRNGTVVTATIIRNDLLSVINESGIGLIWGGGLPSVSTDNVTWCNVNTTGGQEAIKSDVENMIGKSWSEAYLNDLSGHTVYFKDSAGTVYTLIFA